MTDLDWRARAACRGVDTEVFYRHESETHQTLVEEAAHEAMTYCKSCPVARECLASALTEPHQYGIRAGTFGRDRRQMLQLARQANE